MPHTPIYLDHASTTPLSEGCASRFATALQSIWGNSSASHHSVGALSHNSLEEARFAISNAIGARGATVVFTASATEANNLVIQGFASRHRARNARIVLCPIEHKSALESSMYTESRYGTEIVPLRVDSQGHLDMDHTEHVLSDNRRPTLLVCMHTNNEIPVRLPMERLKEVCERTGTYWHCDAVQGFVREDINFESTGATSMTISPHKFYGPKGVGILIVAEDTRAPALDPVIIGGEHEMGFRPGTVNTPAIVAARHAVDHLGEIRLKLRSHMLECQTSFADTLKQANIPFHWAVEPNAEVVGILSFWIDGVDGQTLLEAIPHVCISRGATCSTGGQKFSHVPTALGLPLEVGANMLRASFGFGSNQEQCRQAANEIAHAAKKLLN